MFRPSPPILLSAEPLDESFTLGYVTASSSAPTFTTTTASSAGPLPITVTSLHRLGSRCRSYNGPVQAALHRVRSIALSLPTHLLYLVGLRKGYRASVVEGTSPYLPGLPEVRTKLEWQFWLRLPSDPSLASMQPVSPHRAAHGSFFGHPCLRLHVTSFQVRDWNFTS